jgi:hypothetical protein
MRFLYAALAGAVLLALPASATQTQLPEELSSVEKRQVASIMGGCVSDTLTRLAHADAQARAQGKKVEFKFVDPNGTVTDISRAEYTFNVVNKCFVDRASQDPILAPRFEQMHALPTT